jgi:hypothetical protein
LAAAAAAIPCASRSIPAPAAKVKPKPSILLYHAIFSVTLNQDCDVDHQVFGPVSVDHVLMFLLLLSSCCNPTCRSCRSCQVFVTFSDLIIEIV